MSSEERRRRIRISVAAYAYEIMGVSLMSDAEFDAECAKVDLLAETGNPEMDEWFLEHFNPSTGMWVHKHPNQRRLSELAAWWAVNNAA